MEPNKTIERLNDLLVSELGVSPRFAWKHSRELYFSVQKIVEGEGGVSPQYEYQANPQTGLIELRPVYVNMPMLPLYPESWVLCRFVDADQEAAFKAHFGVRIEYPSQGIWQPIYATIMRAGLMPCAADTWKMIHAARADRRAIAKWLATAEENQTLRERKDADRFGDMCRDKFTARMEVPGAKGSTSFFSAASSAPIEIKKEPMQ